MQIRNNIFIGLVIVLLLVIESSSVAGVLIYSTYLGGNYYDVGMSIAVDSAGNAYITGLTGSTDFPTTAGTADTSFNGMNGLGDAFITKLNPTGSALVYSTYLGGADDDWGRGIAVDNSGNAYITGWTFSADFPTTPGAFDTTFKGLMDAFVAKINPSGTGLVYSTLIGEVGNSESITIDNSGNAYIIGFTTSSTFPTTPGAFDTSYNGGGDAFVSKLNPSGTALIYSTYLGGTSTEMGWTSAIDNSGNAYIIGRTASADFPTTPGAFDTSYNGGDYDTFVAKLNADGSALIYSTFLGGENTDYGHGIALDSSGNTYITGLTRSSTFPTTSAAFDTSFNGGYDVFASKLNPTGTALLYSTYLGGTWDDYDRRIKLDKLNNAYIIGYTKSTDFPTTPGAFARTHTRTGYNDVFITKLDSTGATVLYSTYFGGYQDNYGYDIVLDDSDNIYITGETMSSDFPTTPGAFDTSHHYADDAFVTKIAPVDFYFDSYGEFTTATDLDNWYWEKYDNGINAGTISWIPSFSGRTGVISIAQQSREKGKLSQIFTVPYPGWYKVVASIATDIVEVTKQQKVYLCLQDLDNSTTITATGNLMIQPGAGGFSSASSWQEYEISFYCQNTLIGVQLVCINQFTSVVVGNLYIDYFRVTNDPVQPSYIVSLTNSSFDDGVNGWILEPYGTALYSGIWTTAWSVLALTQDGENKGKASQIFQLSNAAAKVSASVWVYSDAAAMSDTQKVYLYLYSYDSGYTKIIESGSAILQPGKWIPGQWQQMRFGYVPLTNYNSVQLVGINPFGNSWETIYFDEVKLNQ